MGLFKKNKKKSECCTVKIEEINEVRLSPESSCCDIQLEEIPVNDVPENKSSCKKSCNC